MSGNKKIAACIATTSSGENSKARAVSKSPQVNFTTRREQTQGLLANILPRGQENAVSVSSLANLLGVTERKVRDLASEERARGVPIIARGSGGYYLAPPTPEGVQELAAFVRRLRSVGVETLSTAAALERCVIDLSGQISIDEEYNVKRKT